MTGGGSGDIRKPVEAITLRPAEVWLPFRHPDTGHERNELPWLGKPYRIPPSITTRKSKAG